ncbi:MAG: RecT protein [Hyphomicrobiales bacterium]|nr:RecT protein [Hyphomicrobiales bacterium]
MAKEAAKTAGREVATQQEAQPLARNAASQGLIDTKDGLEKRMPEIMRALPPHIPPERFVRVVMTALQSNLDLLTQCDRASLFRSAIKAAQDGLLPDGREGALVPFKGQVAWMPMILGIRKKARNSGEILDWDVQVVREKDEFEYELGDQAFIRHKPYLAGNPGKVIAAYSICHLKDGGISREIMSRHDIDKVKASSRSSSKGPWVDWFDEMARKTVARRHSKSLPMSSDLDDLVRSDDHLYDREGAEADTKQTRRPTLASRMNMLAGAPTDHGQTTVEAPPHDAETGEIAEGDKIEESRSDVQTETASDDIPGDKPTGASEVTKLDPIAVARERGAKAKANGQLARALPAEYRDGRDDEKAAWLDGFNAHEKQEG